MQFQLKLMVTGRAGVSGDPAVQYVEMECDSWNVTVQTLPLSMVEQPVLEKERWQKCVLALTVLTVSTQRLH